MRLDEPIGGRPVPRRTNKCGYNVETKNRRENNKQKQQLKWAIEETMKLMQI